MFVLMLKLPDDARRRYDLASLKGAIHAAAPLPDRGESENDRMVGSDPDRILRGLGGQRHDRRHLAAMAHASRHRRPLGDRPGEDFSTTTTRKCPTGVIGSVYFAQGLAFSYHQRSGEDEARPYHQGLVDTR